MAKKKPKCDPNNPDDLHDLVMAEIYDSPDEELEAECLVCGGYFPAPEYLVEDYFGYPKANAKEEQKRVNRQNEGFEENGYENQLKSAFERAYALTDEELLKVCDIVMNVSTIHDYDKLLALKTLFSRAGINVLHRRSDFIMDIFSHVHMGTSLRNNTNPDRSAASVKGIIKRARMDNQTSNG
jgi:enamine deaminase RidA (YjgF/YER057c/UK114 family)